MTGAQRNNGKFRKEVESFMPACGTRDGHKGAFRRPRLVVALADLSFAAKCARDFQQLGWEVFLVESGKEARHLARRLSPKAVVLGTHLRDESGWLTCEKLRAERPRQKIYLVAAKQKPDSLAFARFVGAAALVSQEDGVDALIEKVTGGQAVISNQ